MYCIHDCAIISTKKFLEKKGITEEDVHVMVSSNS